MSIGAEELSLLREKKNRFAEDEPTLCKSGACENDRCLFFGCTCGKSCTCNISKEVNCEECEDAKKKKKKNEEISNR
jgi:hypothetical protein